MLIPSVSASVNGMVAMDRPVEVRCGEGKWRDHWNSIWLKRVQLQLDRALKVLVLRLAVIEGDGADRVVVADGCRDEEGVLQLGADDNLGARDGFFRC